MRYMLGISGLQNILCNFRDPRHGWVCFSSLISKREYITYLEFMDLGMLYVILWKLWTRKQFFRADGTLCPQTMSGTEKGGKDVCLPWLWRSECQMSCEAQYPWVFLLVFLGVRLDSVETSFAKPPFLGSRNYYGISSFWISEMYNLRYGTRNKFSQRPKLPETTVRKSLKSPVRISAANIIPRKCLSWNLYITAPKMNCPKNKVLWCNILGTDGNLEHGCVKFAHSSLSSFILFGLKHLV